MTQEYSHSAAAPQAQVPDNRDETIRELAQQVAQFSQTPWQGVERRAHKRIPYPRLIPFTPLCENTLQVVGEPIHVVGKNLALLGLDFFHNEPITQRFGVVSLECAPERHTHFVMKLSWCRFIRPGWYDSGGRFTKVVDGTTLEEAVKILGFEKD